MTDDIKLERLDCEEGNLAHYKRMRALLHRSQHPAFMGPDQMARCIKNGGHVWIYTVAGEDVATLWTEPQKTHPGEQHGFVLSVVREWKRRGLARRILAEDGPRFGRGTDDVLGFFEDCGYRVIGPAKQHKKYLVYPLSRDPRDWPPPETQDAQDAARATTVSRDAYAAAKAAKGPRKRDEAESAELLALASLTSLVGKSHHEQRLGRLRLLEAMLQSALRDGHMMDALKIQAEAAVLLKQLVR